MKCNIFLIFLLGSLLVILEVKAKCQSVNNGKMSRIVGGHTAEEGQFPYLVALLLRGEHICGASIISANYVLTAAHCLHIGSPPEPFAVSDLSIRAGSINVYSGGQVVAVDSTRVHPSYHFIDNDVAVLKLAQPLELNDRVNIIALATQDPPAGAQVVISGWGDLNSSGAITLILQFITLTALSNDQCSQRRGVSVPISILCLDHPVGMGACDADSGGPAVYENQLVGIANYFVGDCGSNKPDAYTSVAAHFDWITKNCCECKMHKNAFCI